jgi:hypothetical protein
LTFSFLLLEESSSNRIDKLLNMFSKRQAFEHSGQ